MHHNSGEMLVRRAMSHFQGKTGACKYYVKPTGAVSKSHAATGLIKPPGYPAEQGLKLADIEEFQGLCGVF
jgi:hypothetical protein